jgi:hypothetical protein
MAMNPLQKLGFDLARNLVADLAADLVADLAARPAGVSVEQHAAVIVERIQREVDDISWRQRVQVADGELAKAKAARLRQQLDEIEAKIFGAVEIKEDALAMAYMEQQEPLNVALAALEQQTAIHEAAASELTTYARMLSTQLHLARAELSTVVVMGRAAQDTAAMAGSYRTIDGLRKGIESLRDNVQLAGFHAQAEVDQQLRDSPAMSIARLEESARTAQYRHRIEKLRGGPAR